MRSPGAPETARPSTRTPLLLGRRAAEAGTDDDE